MKSILITSAFLAPSVLGAARPPRAAAAISTLTIEIPSQGVGFTSTVAGCGSVAPFAVVAVANGSFFPGTNTIFLPAQASPSTTTIVNAEESATQVLVAQPLEGSCQDFPPSAPASITDISQLTATGTDGTPTATDSACPLGTLASAVSGAAEDVIDAINKVTLLSQNLQAAAKQIGGSASKHRRNTDDSSTTDLEARQFNTPIIQVASGLRDVVTTLTISIPRITVLPPFDPGDASDAIVIALISFVRVHQALLNILIGRAGLISNFPFADADVEELTAIAAESQTALEQFLGSSGQSMTGAGAAVAAAGSSSNLEARVNPIGAPIAAALRAVEGVVDSLAFAIIDLIPSRNECAKDQKTAIDGTLQESIEAYS
ncbi:uncharacterized protein LTHEOB_10047 [Lasiodiplodia theobromae]|uniref:uncharacterized protein n=1 Tax=Lasiodiplodia theobromae TaxID=45133 RepID=UPI0015C3658A|nr:uncharacterized protein LTHEOB_10047 [Lasiodiplodia theobromae]KAF4539658.1 hypothetical protein LTHEOB_10047 [Lasiodiplodia theobromae]